MTQSTALTDQPARTALGFGAASLGNLYRVIDDGIAEAAVVAALDAGIQIFDTAPHYGQGLSERRIGRVLAASNRPYSLSTKVGRVLTPIPVPPPGTERHGFVDGDPFEPQFDYSYDGIMRSFDDSVRRLAGARITTLLAHDLGQVTHGDDHPRHLRDFLTGGYRAMQALKDQGVIESIGLGVNEWQICEEVLAEVDLDVVLLAGRYTLLEQTALDSFLPLCEARGVSVLAGGPFNSGILSGGDTYNYAPAPQAVRDRVTILKAVCARHGVPLRAAALQFPLDQSAIACVVAGMASAAEVIENVKLMSTLIPASLWDELEAQGWPRTDALVPARRELS